MSKLTQQTFASGEVSPSVYARGDLARFYSALRTCRNFIVRQYGGVMNRPGTEFVEEVKDSNDVTRVLPFVFSTDQAYVLEVGDGYLRFYRDGARLDPATTDVSAWSGATAYVADDYVSRSGAVYRALQAGTNKDPLTEAAYWVLATVYELTSPYTAVDIDTIKYAQSADVMTLVQPNYQPQQLSRYADFDWTIADFANENGPFLETNTTGVTVYASAQTGDVTLTASAITFTVDMVGSLIKLEEQDKSLVPPWEPSKRLSRGVGANPLGLLRRSDGKVYKCATSFVSTGTCTTGTVRPTHDDGTEADGDGNSETAIAKAGVTWTYQHSGFGIVEITGFISGTQVTGTVIKMLPDTLIGGTVVSSTWTFSGDGADQTFSVTGATSSDSTHYRVTVDGALLDPTDYSVNKNTDVITFNTAPAVGVSNVVVEEIARDYLTEYWSLGAWSEENGYPSCVTYYQDRLCFANNAAKPQTVWTSKSSNYTDFGTSSPSADDDAVTFTINARQVNAVRDLVALDSLVLLTSDAEWKVTEGQDQVLTPSTVGVRAQSFNGAADLQAHVYGRSALYVQDRGAIIRDLTYSIQVDGYEGTDRTLLSDHLFRGKSIVDMAFCRIPYSALFAIRDDGVLLTFTYLPDQDIAGWARHDTDGYFERLCVVPEGEQDTVYFVVRRTIGGVTKRYIERLAPRLSDDIRDSFFVDSGLTYDGRNTGATTMTVTGGSTWAAGETVTVTASASTFVSGDTGDWVVMDQDDGKYRILITNYTSGTVVTGELLDPLPAAWRSTASTSWGLARDTFSGLDHLEGKVVSALYDGHADAEFATVTSGSVTSPGWHGVIVHIGLPIEADIETLPLMLPKGETIRDRPKLINKVDLIVQESRGIFAGPDEDNLYEAVPRSDEGPNDPAAMQTGLVSISIDGAYRNDSSVLIRQTDPLPLTICGMIAHVDFGG